MVLKLLAVVFICIMVRPVAAQTLAELQSPPMDTAEARRVRVWVPVERDNNCRMTIDIAQTNGVVVRHMVDHLFTYGYYNFYWDKRDDSGRYVQAGQYRVFINDCGRKSAKGVEAAYRDWEAESHLTSIDTASLPAVQLALEKDSAMVRFDLKTATGAEFGTVLKDTLLMAGDHRLLLHPPRHASPGPYLVDLYIDGSFVKHVEIRLKTR